MFYQLVHNLKLQISILILTINIILILFILFYLKVGLKEGLGMTIGYFKQELKKSQKSVWCTVT